MHVADCYRCPYYLSRELHNSAELIFSPYNYLIDKENRRSLTGISWDRTVLIFDEAHNLVKIGAPVQSGALLYWSLCEF